MPTKPSIVRFTLVSLLRVGIAALIVGGLATWLLGAEWGGFFAVVVVLIVVGYYARKLAQLSHWLTDPQAATLPEGIGLWGETLGDLYRVIRNQRATQQTLTGTLSRFQQAAAALPDGAVMLDAKYNIVWCNPSAEKHLGLSLERDRMQTITYLIRAPEFIAHLDQRNFNEPLVMRLASGKNASQPNLSEVTLSLQLIAFGEDQMLLLSHDISERERVETMRRDFVANVSHELRTPLTVVTGFLETVKSAGTSNATLVEKSLAHMSSQTKRMQGLVEDLLTLSRLEYQRNRLAPAPINAPELIDALVADAQHLSAGRHHIHKQMTDRWLLGNRDEIASAFGNLITNAVRYTPDGGTIHVRWESSDDQGVTFSVIDNGDGIAPEHLPRLTERFYRVDRGRSRASGGTGLGLAIVKHVLLRHDAKLAITSSQDAVNHGTTFAVTFPPARVCTAEPRPQSVAA